jgi:hypothetical protein
MLGKLSLPLRKNRNYTILGGPFVDHIPGTIGVKMAAEIQRPCHINIPTRDYQTPDPEDLRNGLINAVEHMVKGDPLYVGCYAGKGRTGLFLAVLAKAMGIEKPVDYVRANYYSHAVETEDQYLFVMDFPIPPEVTKMLKWARVKSYFTFRTELTNMVLASTPELQKAVWPHA